MEENKSPNRRSFVRRILKFGALGGITTLLASRSVERSLIPPVNANTAYYSDSTQFPDINGVVESYCTATSGRACALYGQTDSWNGRAIFGFASTTTGGNQGVLGYTQSNSGNGVTGFAGNAASGVAFGVRGISLGAGSVAVEGYGNATGTIGVRGTGLPGAIPIVAQAASGQTVNLQEWQNSVASALSVVDKDGKLGIGTGTPNYKLHIISGVTGPLTAASAPGAGPAPNSFICENLTSGNYKNQFTFKASGANKYSFGNDIAGTGGQNFFIWDEVAAQAAMYIDSSQRVGLGTLSPSEKLHVVGNVKAASFITGDIVMSNNAKITEEGTGFAFINDAGEKIAVLDSEGNLQVRGKITENPNL